VLPSRYGRDDETSPGAYMIFCHPFSHGIQGGNEWRITGNAWHTPFFGITSLPGKVFYGYGDAFSAYCTFSPPYFP
jgi:hypothetical protein